MQKIIAFFVNNLYGLGDKIEHLGIKIENIAVNIVFRKSRKEAHRGNKKELA